MERAKVVIIGSGPAAYTAAIYAGRANLVPVIFEGFYSGPIGGQLMTTTEVENFPGFPQGVSGPELMDLFKQQAARFGAQFFQEDVQEVLLGSHPFIVKTSKRSLQSDALIIATGATAKRLDVPGTRDGEFWQKGVTACAVCDGAAPIFRGKDLYVMGGGDSAIEEAIFLTKFAKKVFLVHRRDSLRASKIMQSRLFAHPKISVIWSHELVRVDGDSVLRSVTLSHVDTKCETTFEAGGLFFAIGHTPNTDFLKGQLPVTSSGYIQVKPFSTCTEIDGVFAAGDVQDFRYRQAITAAGSGCMAALDAEHFLVAKGI